MTRAERVEGENLENARVGYQVAAHLAANEQAVGWSRTNAMLLGNSIFILATLLSFQMASKSDLTLLSFLGMASKGGSEFLHYIPVCLALIGLIWSILWFHAEERRGKIYGYWIVSARELEREYLRPIVRTLVRGEGFSDDRCVYVDGEFMNHNWLTRLRMRTRWNVLLILPFIILYILLLVYATKHTSLWVWVKGLICMIGVGGGSIIRFIIRGI